MSRTEYFTEAGHYLDEHMCEKVTLQMLADQACLSKFHYAREFKKESGITPKQFIISRKLQTAERFLADTDMKVCEIAEKIGYDAGQFTNMFKKYNGMSPGEFRGFNRNSRLSGNAVNFNY